MNLKHAKKIAKFAAKSTKKLKSNKKCMPEEDCESINGTSMLTSGVPVTGGSITNSDTYAPNDNRIAKSLFKKLQKRKARFDEDSEEYHLNKFLVDPTDYKSHIDEINEYYKQNPELANLVDDIYENKDTPLSYNDLRIKYYLYVTGGKFKD